MNKKYYLEKTQKRNLRLKVEMLDYFRKYFLQHPCVDCGESDMAVLEFDHNGKTPKYKAVSSLIRYGFPLEKIKEEVKKCDVRCANCHRRKTARDYNWLKIKMPL